MVGALQEPLEELETLIKQKVSTSQHSLLSQAVNVSLLSQDLVTLNAALGTVQQRITELKRQLREPCQELAASIQKLEDTQKASQLLRCVLRFLQLSRQVHFI